MLSSKKQKKAIFLKNNLRFPILKTYILSRKKTNFLSNLQRENHLNKDIIAKTPYNIIKPAGSRLGI